MKAKLKTFIVSISAVTLKPGVKVQADEESVLICELDGNKNPLGRFVTAVGQIPLLLVQHESLEAKEYALQKARELFPESEGWCGHAAVMIEVPRSTFIQMQLFLTIRESVHRALVFAGFRRL